jgi:hypothetical protein
VTVFRWLGKGLSRLGKGLLSSKKNTETGILKSKKVGGKRLIDYQSAKALIKGQN